MQTSWWILIGEETRKLNCCLKNSGWLLSSRLFSTKNWRCYCWERKRWNVALLLYSFAPSQAEPSSWWPVNSCNEIYVPTTLGWMIENVWAKKTPISWLISTSRLSFRPGSNGHSTKQARLVFPSCIQNWFDSKEDLRRSEYRRARTSYQRRWTTSCDARKKMAVAKQMRTKLVAAKRLYLKYTFSCDMYYELSFDLVAGVRRTALAFCSAATLTFDPVSWSIRFRILE